MVRILQNIKNKQHLLSLFVTYLCADDFVQSSPLPILVNNENEIFKILFECIHEETDTRMIFHALQQKANVAVCSCSLFMLLIKLMRSR